MISFPLEDYTGVLEAGIGLALKQANICSRTSRGGFFNLDNNRFDEQPQFQNVRPRTDLIFFYTGGRGRYFTVQPGTDSPGRPQPGIVPDCAHTGIVSVGLITAVSYASHSQFIGQIRRQFDTLIPRLNDLFGGLYMVQTIIPEATDPKIATADGYMISTLKYKVDFGVNHDWDGTQFVEQTVNINDEN